MVIYISECTKEQIMSFCSLPCARPPTHPPECSHLCRSFVRSAPAVGLSTVFYGLYAGTVIKDPPVVSLLKDTFHRTRPSPHLHHSFSYPSGHTTAAVLVTGVLLCVLLPRMVEELARGDPPAHSKPASSSSTGSLPAAPLDIKEQPEAQAASDTTLHASVEANGSAASSPGGVAGALAALAEDSPLRRGVWCAAGGSTAAGRMLADAHWLSDTMAGACVGIGATYLLMFVLEAVEARLGCYTAGGDDLQQADDVAL